MQYKSRKTARKSYTPSRPTKRIQALINQKNINRRVFFLLIYYYNICKNFCPQKKNPYLNIKFIKM